MHVVFIILFNKLCIYNITDMINHIRISTYRLHYSVTLI